MSFDWKSFSGFNKIRYSWSDVSSIDDAMNFPGHRNDSGQLLTKTFVYGWLSTKGSFLDEYSFPDNDRVLGEETYNLYFGPNSISYSGEYALYRIDSSTKRLESNRFCVDGPNGDMTLNRSIQKSYYHSKNYTMSMLQKYAFQLNYKKIIKQNNTNIGCLNIKCPLEEIDSWHANVITIFSDSDVPETYAINKNSEECYIISGFDDTQTTSGMNLVRGNIYKLESSNSIEIFRTQKDNRILHIWKE